MIVDKSLTKQDISDSRGAQVSGEMVNEKGISWELGDCRIIWPLGCARAWSEVGEL
jgi:hypothetical protein